MQVNSISAYDLIAESTRIGGKLNLEVIVVWYLIQRSLACRNKDAGGVHSHCEISAHICSGPPHRPRSPPYWLVNGVCWVELQG